MVQFTFMGVTLYLHRDATHRSLDLHPVLRHIFRFWLWMSSGIVTKEWVAVHRKHHAPLRDPGRSAQPGDFRIEESPARRRRAVPGAGAQSRNDGQVWPRHARRLDGAQRLHALPQLRHRRADPRRPAAVRSAGHHRVVHTADGESRDGRRRDQRHWPLLRLSQLRVPGRRPQHRAVGFPRRRRRAAQQSSRVPELGEVLDLSLGVRHRLDVHHHLQGAGTGEGDSRRAGAGARRAAQAHRPGNGARGDRQSHARAARLHASRHAAGVPPGAAERRRQAEPSCSQIAGA
ncbi:MAG: hypothetical protein HC872_01970 [Gammaproteobacteria bacterium]|nr:hypothetical protein [Gammaproteobacteria bacterium]